jgi:glutathione S-transferase
MNSVCGGGRTETNQPQALPLCAARGFGPVFRYFDVFDQIADFGILTGKPQLARWRSALAARPSVKSAVRADYPVLLRDFIARRSSQLSRLQAQAAL